MRPDDDIDIAVSQILETGSYLRGRAHTSHDTDPYAKRGQSIDKCLIVFESEDEEGRDDGYLST
jgi:hypothetical protein